MKFFWLSCTLTVIVAACSTKKRGVIINDNIVQPPQKNPYQTLFVGEKATFMAYDDEAPTFIYDKEFFDISKNSRCLDLGEEEKTCITLYTFKAIKSGDTWIEAQIKNGRELIESYRNPVLIAEKGDQPEESSLDLSDLLGKHLALLPPSLSMVYLEEQTLQLAKLPDDYQYQFVTDNAGFTMLQKQVDNALNVSITPNAVGKTAIIIEVIDNSRASQMVVIIDVDVQFQENYRLTPDRPFFIQTFGGDWQLSHDRAVVTIVSEDNCLGVERCLAKYALTAKEARESPVKFSNGSRSYQFTVTTDG